MSMLWPIIMSFIAAASVFVPVMVVVFTLRMRSQYDPDACAACGYPKRGSDAEKCPECGYAWRDKTHRRTSAKEEFLVLGALIGVPFMVFVVIMVLLVFAN
ncbi:MAG: hypothetical protein AAGC72_01720 [Planctomycetota bacterium]